MMGCNAWKMLSCNYFASTIPHAWRRLSMELRRPGGGGGGGLAGRPAGHPATQPPT